MDAGCAMPTTSPKSPNPNPNPGPDSDSDTTEKQTLPLDRPNWWCIRQTREATTNREMFGGKDNDNCIDISTEGTARPRNPVEPETPPGFVLAARPKHDHLLGKLSIAIAWFCHWDLLSVWFLWGPFRLNGWEVHWGKSLAIWDRKTRLLLLLHRILGWKWS